MLREILAYIRVGLIERLIAFVVGIPTAFAMIYLYVIIVEKNNYAWYVLVPFIIVSILVTIAVVFVVDKLITYFTKQ